MLKLLLIGKLLSETVFKENAADVAELADAQASGACAPWGVEVRLLSSALELLYSEGAAFICHNPRTEERSNENRTDKSINNNKETIRTDRHRF